MDSPFSPFVRRIGLKDVRKRESEVPSDLIDWEAPEIPELDKQRIIYEELINELKEEHTIETLLHEEVLKVVAESVITENSQEFEARIQELDQTKTTLEATVKELESKVEILHKRYKELEDEYKLLEFRNQEIENELGVQVEVFLNKKSEAEDLKRKWENARNQLNYYKKLAKGDVK